MFNLIPYLSVVENVILPCGFSSLREQRAAEAVGSVETEALRLLGHLDMAAPGILHRRVTDLSVGRNPQARGLLVTW